MKNSLHTFGALLSLVLFLTACSHAGQNISSTRNPPVHFKVAEPLALEAVGSVSGSIPAESSFITPLGRMNFELYAEKGQVDMDKFAIISRTTMTQSQWAFDLERNVFHIIAQSSFRKYGQFWTEQLIMVDAAKDWFAAFWKANGRTTPEGWIALRYSATPNPQVRILVEYREKTTPCMKENWQNHPTERRMSLIGLCSDDIQAFQGRARAAISIEEGLLENTQTPNLAEPMNPRFRPNFAQLVGLSIATANGRDNEIIP